MAEPAGEIVLILATGGRDGEIAQRILGSSGIQSCICRSVDELTSELHEASAAIVTIEELGGPHLRTIIEWVCKQPDWSDFPFILLTLQNSSTDESLLMQLGNVAILERPFHAGTLAAATRGALRARRRQRTAEALIHEHEAISARQKVLIRELHHRVRNMLATIQGVMAVTSRSSGNIREFTRSFSERLQSLARTHQLLTDDLLQSASLVHLLQQELQPFDDGAGLRFELRGPPVDLPSSLAVPFGMAIHELTTNALKYGALSLPSGRIIVDWHVQHVRPSRPRIVPALDGARRAACPPAPAARLRDNADRPRAGAAGAGARRCSPTIRTASSSRCARPCPSPRSTRARFYERR